MLEDSRVRYTFRVELFAAYDILKIGRKELPPDRDLKQEIAKLIRELEQQDPEKLTDEVYYSVQLDLCPRCRQEIYEEMKSRFGGLPSTLTGDSNSQ
jgi:hypothetical protein